MKVRLLITGGTIDKVYNQSNGELEFDKTHFPEMVKRSRVEVDLTLEEIKKIYKDLDKSVLKVFDVKISMNLKKYPSLIILSYILIALLLQKKTWYRNRVTKPISIIVASIGFYWFFERLFFLV